MSYGRRSCKGQRVRYGVMCVNVSMHGSMWKSMYVHRLALLKDPSNLGLQEMLHLRCDASHLCHNTLYINPSHISLEPHWLNNGRQYTFAEFQQWIQALQDATAVQLYRREWKTLAASMQRYPGRTGQKIERWRHRVQNFSLLIHPLNYLNYFPLIQIYFN